MLSTILSKKNGRFCEVSLFSFLLISPVWEEGWVISWVFGRCKRSPFGICKYFRLHLTSVGQLHAPMILSCDFKQIESFDSDLKKDWVLKSTALFLSPLKFSAENGVTLYITVDHIEKWGHICPLTPKQKKRRIYRNHVLTGNVHVLHFY